MLMSWIIFYFDAITTGYKNISFKSKTFQDIEIFEEYFENSFKKYKKTLFLEWNIFTQSKKGFSLLVLANQEETSGVLWWVYNTMNNSIIYGDIDKYSIHHPFFKELNEDEIILIKSDINNFLENISENDIQYFWNINVIKFWIEQINTPQILKIDFVITFEIIPEFIGKYMREVIEDIQYRYMKFSLIY